MGHIHVIEVMGFLLQWISLDEMEASFVCW